MTQFRKKDVLFSLIISEAIACLAVLILFILNRINLYLWFLPAILPILTLIGIVFVGFIGKKFPVIFQIFKFTLVGFLNAAIDFAVLNLLMWQTGIYKGWPIILFNIIAFSIAIINSYSWNKLWTFQAKGGEIREVSFEFFQFVVIAIVGAFINTGIVFGLTTYMSPIFGISKELWANFAKVLATTISLMWNFSGYKFIVFKK